MIHTHIHTTHTRGCATLPIEHCSFKKVKH
uniref:Uncharacterized protein n=1 Tax=Anguilla anguilla TaxID=7936 RepID=A0A0E9W0F8_ANGAN